MPGKRDPNKIRVQTWVTKSDKKALEALAKDKGYSNLAEFLSAIARGVVKLVVLASLVRWLCGSPPATAIAATLADAARIGSFLVKSAVQLIS